MQPRKAGILGARTFHPITPFRASEEVFRLFLTLLLTSTRGSGFHIDRQRRRRSEEKRSRKEERNEESSIADKTKRKRSLKVAYSELDLKHRALDRAASESKLRKVCDECLGTSCRRRTRKRRNAQRRCTEPLILRYPNGETRLELCPVTHH